MPFVSRVKSIAMAGADQIFARLPQVQPAQASLAKARVIAHRGLCASDCRENTLTAFDRAIHAGAWGVEFDVRWSGDGVPLVHHDADTKRVFGSRLSLADANFEQIRKQFPEIPTLEETMLHLRGRAHAVIELKGRAESFTQQKQATLKKFLLQNLDQAETDFHVMALDLELLGLLDWLPRNSILPIAEINIRNMSRYALEKKLGGLTGQYVLLRDGVIEKHLAAGQIVGTGFVSSETLLWREVNRGVTWVFTNHTDVIAKAIAKVLQPAGM